MLDGESGPCVQEAAHGKGAVLQTLAHALCAETSPDEALPLSRKAGRRRRKRLGIFLTSAAPDLETFFKYRVWAKIKPPGDRRF